MNYMKSPFLRKILFSLSGRRVASLIHETELHYGYIKDSISGSKISFSFPIKKGTIEEDLSYNLNSSHEHRSYIWQFLEPKLFEILPSKIDCTFIPPQKPTPEILHLIEDENPEILVSLSLNDTRYIVWSMLTTAVFWARNQVTIPERLPNIPPFDWESGKHKFSLIKSSVKNNPSILFGTQTGGIIELLLHLSDICPAKDKIHNLVYELMEYPFNPQQRCTFSATSTASRRHKINPDRKTVVMGANLATLIINHAISSRFKEPILSKLYRNMSQDDWAKTWVLSQIPMTKIGYLFSGREKRVEMAMSDLSFENIKEISSIVDTTFGLNRATLLNRLFKCQNKIDSIDKLTQWNAVLDRKEIFRFLCLRFEDNKNLGVGKWMVETFHATPEELIEAVVWWGNFGLNINDETINDCTYIAQALDCIDDARMEELVAASTSKFIDMSFADALNTKFESQKLQFIKSMIKDIRDAQKLKTKHSINEATKRRKRSGL